MWTLVAPLVSQCCKTVVLQLSKGRLLSTGGAAAVLGSKSMWAPSMVYIPLKDVEVVALQQLS